MKKIIIQTYALVAVIALSGIVCGSCGGSSGGSTDDGKGMPTDGILGSFPKTYFECIDGINSARADMAVGSDEEYKTAKAELEKLQEQLKTIVEAENVASIEIPTEVAEGIPFKVVKPLVVTNADEKQLTLEAVVESTESVDQYTAYNYGYLVAYDTDGKPFSTGQHGTYVPDGSSSNWATGTKGKLTIYLSVAEFNIEGLARLGKLLIVTGKSEEMKQATAAMSELQSAAMKKTREALEKLSK